MATRAPITSGCSSGTYPPSFMADADALDVITDRIHTNLMAEATMAKWFRDLDTSGLTKGAADEWAACAAATVAFLARPFLHASHVLCAEHILDVLQDREADRARLRWVPDALMSAAARADEHCGLADMVLTRQLSHLAGVLRLVIEGGDPFHNPDSNPDDGAPSLT